MLPIHYLHDTSITPHPSHRGGGGKVDPRWIIYMLATCDLLTVLHTSCAIDTLPSAHPPHRGGGGNVDPTSIIYMLATCQLYPTQSLQHTAYIQDHDHEGGGVAGLSHIYIYIYDVTIQPYWVKLGWALKVLYVFVVVPLYTGRSSLPAKNALYLLFHK